MSSFRSTSILFHVVKLKTSNKKRGMKFLNVFKSVNFFRDAKMSNINAKMKNAKKNIDLYSIKNTN